MNYYICPECKGVGKPNELFWRGRWHIDQSLADVSCPLCEGWGRVTREQIHKRADANAQARYLAECDEQDQLKAAVR